MSNKTIFTTLDIKSIIENVFNKNSEEITITNGNSEEKVSIKDYLNIDFYTFNNDLRSSNPNTHQSRFGDWFGGLTLSHNKSYALIETIDEEATISPDIDFVEKQCNITFVINESKANVLDYYVQKIRNTYLGMPQKTQNKFGQMLNTYLLFGILNYDEEPENTPLGKTIICSVSFKLTYLTNALTYNDYDISMSFDGSKYYHLPFNELSMQVIFANDTIAKYQRNDLAGIRNKTCSFVFSVSFYDFLQPLSEQLNKKFMLFAATKINNENIPIHDINEIIYLKIKVSGDEYLFYCSYDNMQKRMENASYSNTSITLKGSAVDVV